MNILSSDAKAAKVFIRKFRDILDLIDQNTFNLRNMNYNKLNPCYLKKFFR